MKLIGTLSRLSWFSIVLLPGCKALPRPLSSMVTIGPDVTARADGRTDQPASVATTVSRGEIILPAGSVLIPAGGASEQGVRLEGPGGGATPPPGFVSARLSEPAKLSFATEERRAQTATPEKGPSPIEVARAGAFKWFVLVSLVLFVGAVALAYAQHWLAAIKVAIAAVVLPVVGHLVSSVIAMTIVAGLLGAAGCAVWVWYARLRVHEEPRVDARAT